MSFGDWLTRFFIHLARRSPWSKNSIEAYIAEYHRFESLQSFVRGTRRGAVFIPGDPATFVSELYGRWTEKFGTTTSQLLVGNASVPSDSEKDPKGKIFVSYAREDKEAAKTLCDCLRKAGCDVWFDESELDSGEAYRNTMEQVIRVDCCAFISIISRHTEANAGFFHQERVWAAVRSAYEGAIGDFYLPVIVDPGVDTQLKREPRPQHFNPNLVIYAGGKVDGKFCDRVIDLQKRYRDKLRKK
jgi:TIR domain